MSHSKYEIGALKQGKSFVLNIVKITVKLCWHLCVAHGWVSWREGEVGAGSGAEQTGEEGGPWCGGVAGLRSRSDHHPPSPGWSRRLHLGGGNTAMWRSQDRAAQVTFLLWHWQRMVIKSLWSRKVAYSYPWCAGLCLMPHAMCADYIAHRGEEMIRLSVTVTTWMINAW